MEWNFIFKLKRNLSLDYQVVIPSKLIDHLLIPIYGLVIFLFCLASFIPYTIFYMFKKQKERKK